MISVRRIVPVLAAAVFALAAGMACNDNSDHATTPTGGSLAQVELGGPSAPVASGESFNVDVKARNVGFSVLHDVHVHVVLPPPIVIESAEVTSGGGTVSSSNGANGGTADFSFGTIDKNSQSSGTIHLHGTLGGGTNNVPVTVTAELTSDEVHAGDAEASITLTLQQ